MRYKYLFLYLIILLFSFCKNENKELQGDSKTITQNNDSTKIYLDLFSNENNELRKGKLLNKSVNYLQNQKNTQKNRDYFPKIILNYYTLNDFDNLKKTAYLLKNKSLQANDSISLATSFRFIAGYHKIQNVLDSAYYYYGRAEKIFLKKNDLPNYNIVLLNKGIVLTSINDLYSAELTLKEALIYYKKSEDYTNLYGTLNQLGVISFSLKEFKVAKNYFELALKLIQENNINSPNISKANCYSNIAGALIGLEQYNLAINNINLALEDKSIKKNDLILYSYLIDNLSYSKMKLGNLSGVKEGFLESFNIRKNIKDYYAIILSYNHLSDYYSTIGDEANSIKHANLALQTAKKSKSPFNLKSALEQASKVDKNNASNYSQEYIRISDSLQIVERKNADRFARIELETDELRQQYFELEERNREIMNYLLGVFLIGGIFFFLRIQRARSREVNLKQAQVEANEEIYRLMISHQHQIDEGRDLEKKRISRELHDGLLGRLFGLRLNLEGLNKFDDDEAIQTRQEYLDELKIIEQDLRDISHELNRENIVLINNFETILNNLLESQAKSYTSARLSIQIDQSIDWELLNNTAKINLYRILQESLQNINKYAKAKNVTVSFRKDVKGNLHFTVEDDGVGFDAKLRKIKGIGIENIIERVQACNGEIDIISEKGKGSKIFIIFPFDNESIKI